MSVSVPVGYQVLQQPQKDNDNVWEVFMFRAHGQLKQATMKAACLPQAHREGSLGGLSLSGGRPEPAAATGSSLSNESTDGDEHKGLFLPLRLCSTRCLSLVPTFSQPHVFRSISVVEGRSAKHLERIVHAFPFSGVDCGDAFYVSAITCAEYTVHSLLHASQENLSSYSTEGRLAS